MLQIVEVHSQFLVLMLICSGRSSDRLTTKTFVDFENPRDADANNNYAVSVTYTSDTNSFTDNVSLSITNSTADDVVTQAAGRPLVGRNAIEAASLISEKNENFTIYGNVGTAEIDVNGGSSAYEIVSAINGRQGETGVYANAITRVNINFPEQFDELDDAVSFMLKGLNEEPVLVSGSVESRPCWRQRRQCTRPSRCHQWRIRKDWHYSQSVHQRLNVASDFK